MANENNTKKVSELNNILKELMDDAKTFASDMISSIYLYYFAGTLSFLFGLQTGWYNRNYILNGDFIPLFLVIAQIFLGAVVAIRGYSLKKKYARIFELNKRL